MKTEMQMSFLKLEYKSYTDVTREADFEDEWNHDSTSTNWIFNNLKLLDRDEYGLVSVDYEVKKGDTLYPLIAVWSTGDSFGNDDGAQMEMFTVYRTYEEADKAKKIMEKAGNSSCKILDGDGKEIEFYPPWVGYFESLDYIDIDKLEVI
jgi:hypothetical protein